MKALVRVSINIDLKVNRILSYDRLKFSPFYTYWQGYQNGIGTHHMYLHFDRNFTRILVNKKAIKITPRYVEWIITASKAKYNFKGAQIGTKFWGPKIYSLNLYLICFSKKLASLHPE